MKKISLHTFLRGAAIVSLCAIGLTGQAGAQDGEKPEAATPAPVTVTVHPVTANVTVTDEQMLHADKDPDNWLVHGRTYDSQSFSPLTGINKKNVKKLVPVALIHTGMVNSFENTPIEVNGVLYIVTASDHVQAYDAVTGKLFWTYTPKLDYSEACCGPQAKGVAVAYGKVFVPQLDGRVVALDARTGEVVWRTNQVDSVPAPTHYYSFTSAPQAYKGMIILGNAGAEYPTRGFVEALDANTGKLIWRFRTTAAPDEPGGDTWTGDSWQHGGGSVWNTPSIDPKNGLVAFAVANPNPDYHGEDRIGDNAYTDSIVAAHVDTGKIAWWYQEVKHDLWDYDAVSPVVMFDALDNGKMVPAAAEAGKVGDVFIVNRLTGKLLHQVPFVKKSANQFDAPTEQGVTVWPGPGGGAQWSPPAFSPLTHYFYIMGINQAFTVTRTPMPKYVASAPTVGQQVFGVIKKVNPEFEPYGTVSAIDVNTGKIAWEHRTPLPMYGGLLATGSNLVFAGELTGNFDALDAKTGELLWQYYLGIGSCTPPITYRVKGVQYVAVGASGCSRGRDYYAYTKLPQYSDTLAIFALPKGK